MEPTNSIENWDLYHKIMGTPTIWETENKYKQKVKRKGIIKRLLRRWRKYLSSFKGK